MYLLPSKELLLATYRLTSIERQVGITGVVFDVGLLLVLKTTVQI